MVHGRTAYIVACGPRTNGSKPGSVSVCARPCRSAAVYSGLTVRPSGVTQFSASSRPPGADFAAAFAHCSRVAAGIGGGVGMAVLARRFGGARHRRQPLSVAESLLSRTPIAEGLRMAHRTSPLYMMHNYEKLSPCGRRPRPPC